MPEYLAPGVYVEETSFRAKSIEGVGTSTTAFVGPTRKGPVGRRVPARHYEVLGKTPEIVTSFSDFQRVYGGIEDLELAGIEDEQQSRNYIAQAVRAYFDNGGSRLYVSRVFSGGDQDAGLAQSPLLVVGDDPPEQVRVRARFPGGGGNGTFVVRQVATVAGPKLVEVAPDGSLLRTYAGEGELADAVALVGGIPPFRVPADSVLALTVDGNDQQIVFTEEPGSDLTRVTADDINRRLIAGNVPARAALAPGDGRLRVASLSRGANASIAVREVANSVHATLGLSGQATQVAEVVEATLYLKTENIWRDANGVPLGPPGTDRREILSLAVVATDADGDSISYEDLGFDRIHPRWIGAVLKEIPDRRGDALQNPFWFEVGSEVSAFDLARELFAAGDQRAIRLAGGHDGGEPVADDYNQALECLLRLEDISIVAAPGHSAYSEFEAIQLALITHAEQRRSYRIAVLDTPPNQTVGEARDVRSRIDSKYAALYHPWVIVANPLFRPGNEQVPREIALPPSGFVCGIYARNDVERGVFKAPANEVVRGALRFEDDINFGEQQVLNPIGVNCLRFFPGRGYRVWGARTVSSDPEWKYVNIRRYFNYLESSIDRGTQWAVFEPNGERLWANVRDTISSFLYNEWVSGALLGTSPKEAFFVRCDRSTMTQNDLDNGRLICLVGVAAIKPAEFVIFRIGQKTADSRS